MNWNMKESLIGGRNVPHRCGLSLNKASKDTDQNMDFFSRNRQSLSVISFDGSDRSDHQVSGGKGIHWVILLLISLLVSAAFIIGILGAYKYWQKRKREKDQARFLLLFEDGNEIDNELDQRNKSCPFVLIDENGTLNDAELATFVKEVKMAEGGVPYSLISTIGPQSSDQRNKSFPFVLIDKNGTLNDARLADFVNEVKMAEGGVPYFLISIIGPQSSGKSTLLNHVFRTNFTEMDAKTKRGATTHGIWLAKSPDADNCTLVMDLEGSDGNERGEDGTTFEKQAALFAFAVSNIVLINMWSNSVGCVHAASMPLLRSVFEARRKLKIHDSKTTLWFVLHDNTNPIDIIKKCLREDISQAWDLVAKGTPLSNSFEVKITVLSHYVLQRQQFYGEVVNLRQKLLAELTINGKKKRPSSGFSLSVQDLWQKIKEDKDLDLPACRVMVAKVRCEEIADKILSSFENKDWHHLPQAVQSGQVKDFGKCLNLNINEHLSLYDKETEYYDEGVRTKKRRELHDTMMKHVKPTCDTMLEYIHSQILNEFKEEFPKEFRWKRAFDKQAICDYIKSFKTKFNQRCKDTGVYQFCRTLSKSRARLLHDDMITHANEVYPGVDFGFLWATGLAAAGIAACIILGPTRFSITAACAMMRRK